MFDRISSFIVAKRRAIGVLFILLAAASVFMINKSVINYDIASYLGKETRTRKGLDIMEREFGSTNQMTLLLSNAPEGEAVSLAERLSALDGIMRTDFSAEPDTKLYNGVRYERIHLYVDSEDPIAYYDVLNSWLDENCAADYVLCGDAALTIELYRILPTA